MKIALVHKKYTTHGGTERYMVGLSKFLVDKGHEVHVFTGSWDKSVANKKIEFHKVALWGKHLGISKYVFAKNALKAVKKYDFDIVQTFSRVGFGDVIRIGGGCHDVYVRKKIDSLTNPFDRIKEKIERSISISDYLTRYYEAEDFKDGNYKKIVVVSQMVKEEIINNYDVDEKDIVVNHNGVDIEKFKIQNRDLYREEIRDKHGLSQDDFVLLFLGTGFQRKGLHYILKAIKEIPDVKLLVVGRGNTNKFKRIAVKLGVLAKVTFVGPIKKVAAYYAAGDIFVFPSIYDPCANVTLEAMASGLPVITTRSNGASGIIDNGVNGYILDEPDNIKQLISYIKNLSKKERRNKLALAAASKMLDFAKQKNNQKMLDIYQEIAKIKISK